MSSNKFRRILAPIKIEQRTLLKFCPLLPEPKKRILAREIEKIENLSSCGNYTPIFERPNVLGIQETNCLNCGARLLKNGHNSRSVILDKGFGRFDFQVHRRRCPNCGEIKPDYSRFAPKFCNYHENFRRRARQHYIEGLMPSQIKRALKIDMGVNISRASIVNWVNNAAKPLRETLSETPIPSSGYWGYDEIHMRVGGEKMYALTTVDTNTKFVPVALVSPSMGSKAGGLLFREARHKTALKIKGLVKDCTTNLGALLRKRSYKHVLQQNCKTHVKWIFSRHVKVFAGLPAGSTKPVPAEWRWLLNKFYNVIDAKDDTDAYIKLEILRSDVERLKKIKPKKHKRLAKAFDQLEKWLPKLLAYRRNPFIATTNNVLEGFHKKFEYYPSFKRNMMTQEGAQRVLDYRVFGHNFKKFPEALAEFETSYKEFRDVLSKSSGDLILRGQGMYFKRRREKLNCWYQNYYELWEHYFVII